MAGVVAQMKHGRRAWGFTLIEIVVAVAALGIISIGALRLYVTTFGVQHKLARDYDLRQAGTQVLNEMGRGFRFGEAAYGGVHGASKVRVDAAPTPALGMTTSADDGDGITEVDIVYAWDAGTAVVTRTIGAGPPEAVLTGVERFHLYCEGKIVRVHAVLVGEGSPTPRAELDVSLRPRIAKLDCD